MVGHGFHPRQFLHRILGREPDDQETDADAYRQTGATLQTTAFSVPHLMIGRYITGIGTGIETSTVPMYQSELCEAEKRGRLVSSEPLFVGVGIEIAYWYVESRQPGARRSILFRC